MLRRALLGSLLSLAVAGCGGESNPQPEPFPSADTKDFTRATGLVTAEVTVDQQGGRLIVDTGSPVVLLDPSAFPAAPQVGQVGTLVVNETSTFSSVDVISAADLTSPDPDVPIGGLLGCTIVCKQKASFDYVSGKVFLGGGVPSAAVGPTQKLPFSFEGGETVSQSGQSVTIPRSRVVVSVTIEGVAHPMIVDTGASSVTIRSTAFAEIVKDGRPTLKGPTIETTEGTSNSIITRVATMSVGPVESKDVILVGDAATDMFFDAVAKEVGHPIDGSLGGSFLGRHFVTVDYPNETLELAAYDDPSFMVDLGTSIGFLLGNDGPLLVVQSVDPGSEAATKGVSIGDTVKAIDGKDLTKLIPSQIVELLSGRPGLAREVSFGTAKSSAIGDKTVTLHVVDLLALP
jgi:hypothetical protein